MHYSILAKSGTPPLLSANRINSSATLPFIALSPLPSIANN